MIVDRLKKHAILFLFSSVDAISKARDTSHLILELRWLPTVGNKTA